MASPLPMTNAPALGGTQQFVHRDGDDADHRGAGVWPDCVPLTVHRQKLIYSADGGGLFTARLHRIPRAAHQLDELAVLPD
jgi:hypothetical protein